MRVYALALFATVAVAADMQGQQAGTIELGLFPQVSYFDRSLRLQQGRAGPAARLGFFFTDHLAVEGEGAWVPNKAPNDSDVSYIPLRARLAWPDVALAATPHAHGGCRDCRFFLMCKGQCPGTAIDGDSHVLATGLNVKVGALVDFDDRSV